MIEKSYNQVILYTVAVEHKYVEYKAVRRLHVLTVEVYSDNICCAEN